MINQEQYTTQILLDFGMDNCNAVKTPCPTFCLTMEMCPKTDDKRWEAAKLPYCALIRKCMYLSNCMCPDISFAICKLVKFMSNYGPKHFEAAKYLLRYLQGTHGRGIIYRNLPNPYPIFTSFTDSDWAMSKGRKSISGFIMQYANGPLTWSSKQQVVVMLSLCKAEYITCSHCACQVLWLWTLFHKLGFLQTKPIPLYCDNQGTVACTHDPQSHSWMKHIDICAHFIRNSINKWLVNVHHIPSTENPVDLLTKLLYRTIYNKWLQHIAMHQDLLDNVSAPSGHRSQGGVGTWSRSTRHGHTISYFCCTIPLLFPSQSCHCIPFLFPQEYYLF